MSLANLSTSAISLLNYTPSGTKKIYFLVFPWTEIPSVILAVLLQN